MGIIFDPTPRTTVWGFVRLLVLIGVALVATSTPGPVQGFSPTASSLRHDTRTVLDTSSSSSASEDAASAGPPEVYLPVMSHKAIQKSPAATTTGSSTRPKKQWANTAALNDVRNLREARRQQQQQQQQQQPYSFSSSNSNNNASLPSVNRLTTPSPQKVLQTIQHEKEQIQLHYDQLLHSASEHDKKVRAPTFKDHGHLHFQLNRKKPTPLTGPPPKKRFVGPPPEKPRRRSLLPSLRDPIRSGSWKSSPSPSSSSSSSSSSPPSQQLVEEASTTSAMIDTNTKTPAAPQGTRNGVRWQRYRSMLGGGKQ